MTARQARMRIGFIEPHLLRFGGIRRIIELGNRLVERGHTVTVYLPKDEHGSCTWMTCRADVRRIEESLDDPLDVLVFNEESQWYHLARFSRARRRVFYALHYGMLYDKPGAWESLRTPVHAQLANSRWTAEQLEKETGHRPEVVLGGINRHHFHPLDVPKRYPVLCVGDSRPWKGTDTIRRATSKLGLPLECYAGKDLPQSRMAAEYGSAEVFVVGSHFEGFGQPGLEALACGVPLVTTDNGGCREYAVHEETALLVPAGDWAAMAVAIERLRSDRDLAGRLVKNGLELVREKFDWDETAQHFEVTAGELLAHEPAPLDVRPNQGGSTEAPLLSIVVLAWDQLHYTQRCVQSIRQHTDVSYELILVDNGSEAPGVAYARQAGDHTILNGENLGFARGMNQGLAVARGDYVAFCNNDVALPQGWASPLLEHFGGDGRTGIVVPGVTAAGNRRTVLAQAGSRAEVIAPFEAPPSAVIYVMHRETAVGLGGWGEEFPVASAEDVDLCFKVWVNDLDIVFDHRVLVDHVGKGTAGTKLKNYEHVWSANRRVLLEKWTSEDVVVPHLPGVSDEVFERNRQVARSVAGWMRLYFRARERSVMQALLHRRAVQFLRRLARWAAGRAYAHRHRPTVRRAVAFVRAQPTLRRFMGQ